MGLLRLMGVLEGRERRKEREVVRHVRHAVLLMGSGAMRLAGHALERTRNDVLAVRSCTVQV